MLGAGDDDADLALLGELDGVADEVGQDLLDPHHVADDPAVGLGGQLDLQRQALLMGPRFQQGGHSARGVGQVERLVLDLQAPGLDAGQVQHVGQQPAQRLSR